MKLLDSKTKQPHESEGEDPLPPQHNDDSSPSSQQQHVLVGSVLEWTEADTVGSAMSMLDLVGLGTKLLHQQQHYCYRRLL
jgi:hypothetical protein